MQNSNGLNKNILILSIVLFVLVAALSVMFGLSKKPVSSPAPVLEGSMAQAIDKNIAELDNFNSDLVQFNKDNVVSEELDVTLSEAGEINGVSVSLTNDEKTLTDLDTELTDLFNEEKINAEIDQVFKDISM